MNLAKLCQTFHNIEESKENWEKAIEIVEKVKGKESIECIELKITFSKFLIDISLHERAEKILLQVLYDQQNCDTRDEVDLVGLYHNLAILYTSLSQFDNAHIYFDKALLLLDYSLCEKAFVMHNKG